MILTNKQHVKHLFAGQNTPHSNAMETIEVHDPKDREKIKYYPLSILYNTRSLSLTAQVLSVSLTKNALYLSLSPSQIWSLSLFLGHFLFPLKSFHTTFTSLFPRPFLLH